jgi:MATE family multidrug resistance protein
VFFLIVGFMISLSVLKIALADYLALPFTDDEEVGQKVASLVFIVCLFQVSDGVQAAIGGVMRGMGHQRTVAAMNFVGFWVIGVSLGAILTFPVDMGVAGLWWGLAAGLTCTALLGAVIILRTNWSVETEAAQQRVGAKKPSSTEEDVRKDLAEIVAPTCGGDAEKLPDTSSVAKKVQVV